MLIARLPILGLGALLLAGCASVAQESASHKVCADCVKQTMEMLAAPEMNGRGCGTADEHAAAARLADQFKAIGLAPAGDPNGPGGGYLQEAPFTPRNSTEMRKTHNVVGMIKGSAADADSHAILLSAHYDHVGVRNGVVYPGANDDASGTAAVVEFARLLGQGKAPKRTVIFALFGCEEAGGFGARRFTDAPPVPLSGIAANLQFEMIGLPDAKRPDMLMLTGWERSNLGPTLAARGAKIGPDLYPEQNFFMRSDNIQLARRGVVAQTISAWPTPPTYHQPTDTIANLDLDFMVTVIQSLAEPIDWLVNSDFRPAWNPGGQPPPVQPRPTATPAPTP